MTGKAPATIDAYLADLPERTRNMLEQVRERIAAAAPDAAEGIKYGMPTATLNGSNIVYYAGWKAHIGLYPIYRGPPAYESELAPYRDKKDTVRFALDKPLPLEIVDLILSTRVAMIREEARGEG